MPSELSNTQGIERALSDIALAISCKVKYGLSIPDMAWHEVGVTGEPAFEHGWVNYGGVFATCAFRIDAMGFVHLKGLIKSGSSTIFMLPIGYHPNATQIFPTVCFNSELGCARIYSTGNVVFYTGSNKWFSLDSITFKAEQ